MASTEQIGPYLLQRCLARGDAAEVWLARRADAADVELILKRLLPPWTEQRELRESFLELIKEALPLRHRHLVSMLDFGDAQGFLYVAFEQVLGQPLASLLETQAPLGPQETLRMGASMLSGLAFVHRATNPFTGGRLIHGDVSPQNLLVEQSYDARLVDLGFARVVIEAGLPGKPSRPLPRYIAPEVQAGGPLSVAADVYGAGRVLADLIQLTAGESAVRMEEVARRAADEDPACRYPDAGEMLRALAPILPGFDAAGADAPERQHMEDVRATTEVPLASDDPSVYLGRRYDIVGELGRGSMGVVLKARDRSLDELVAIKLLPLDRIGDLAGLERFRRELTLARQVRHPNVARVDHFEEGPGFAYYTMELVEGQTLERRLSREGPLPLPDLLELTRQLAGGLAAVHGAGIIHRDVKSANVILTDEGRCVLMDFGVARQLQSEVNLTGTGMAMGTPLYMSPEQSTGAAIDHRTDLFALGVLLYEAATGRCPFQGSTAVALYLEKKGGRAAPPIDLRPELGPELSDLILRLLAPEKEDRPADAEAVLSWLE